MKKKNAIITFFGATTFIVSVLMNEVSLLDVVLLLLSLGGTIIIINRYNPLNNLAKLLCLAIVYISVVAMPAYHIVINGEQQISQIDYNYLVSFGARVYFVTILALFVSSSFFPLNKSKLIILYHPKRISHSAVYLFFVFLFLLTSYCLITGLGRMGWEAVPLPFHLGGIINLFRGVLAPFIFAIIIENYSIRKEKVPKWFYGIFLLWTLFETFAWMSKGIWLLDFLPVAIVLYLNYRPSIKTCIRYMLPFFVVFLYMYPIIAVMRTIDNPSESLFDSFKSSRMEVASGAEGVGTTFIVPLNRAFMTSTKYIQDHDYIDQNSLFDFSKAPALFVAGGASAYQTFVIDGYPPSAIHSSGTTGIIDPLLHGGFGLCFIVIFFIMIFAVLVDRSFYKHQYVIYIQLLLLMSSFINTSNISSFYDGVGLQTLVARLVSIYLAYIFCYKRKIVLSR